MKFNNFFFIMLSAFFFTAVATAQTKPASPAVVTTGKINGANISINYGSPAVRGRVIWGGLVPFSKIWRAGANDATTFETDKELEIEGTKLPAGKYSFFVLPSEKNCVLIFNKIFKQWGAYNYNEKEDQLRVTVTQMLSDSSAENLTYMIEKNAVVLHWDKWKIAFNVK